MNEHTYNAAALSAEFHTDARYAEFYDKYGEHLGGFPGIWSTIADIADVLSAVGARIEWNGDFPSVISALNELIYAKDDWGVTEYESTCRNDFEPMVEQAFINAGMNPRPFDTYKVRRCTVYGVKDGSVCRISEHETRAEATAAAVRLQITNPGLQKKGSK